MAKYILYEEIDDEGKHIIGEYKRKYELKEDVTKMFYSMYGNPDDLDNILKLSDDDYDTYKQVTESVKWLMKTQKTVFGPLDNIYTYEKV